MKTIPWGLPRRALAVSAVSFLAFAAAAQAAPPAANPPSPGGNAYGLHKPCSVASAEGTFGATGRGTAVGRGLLSAVGILTFDGKGGFTAKRTIHSGDQIIPDHTVEGTYTVNENCTGSLSYSNGGGISGGSVTHNDLVVDGDGQGLRIVGTDAGFTVTVEARKQFMKDKPDSCSPATIEGRYAATGTGSTVTGEPLAAVGFLDFDGKGTFSVTRSVSLNGKIVPKQTVTGTYTLAPDCTGFVEYVSHGVPVGQIKRNYLVIDQDGAELRAMGLDASLLDTILAHR